jgi:hypothetical protein
MNVAACWSITALRCARLASAAISSLSTATVDKRSSQSAIGSAVREIAREGAGRLGTWTFAAVHINRKSKHESHGTALCGEFNHPRCVELELFPRNRFNRRCQAAIRIADSDADRFGAKVEADESAAHR